ncbi:MAG: hypothetical protein OXH54_01025 [Acidimicrobiaceae bacterium]|nr:hypothetical protein [Acidimicrobiaceae bacterium]MCY3642137.1 hypothetical protein [Acidimicrobiaceae bacterium]MDE0492497.1 hypothetical protein [Acidimicrobiaceae bacterium]
MRLGRAWLAAPLLAAALLVAVVGSASATTDGEAPLVVNPDQSGSLGVVSTAQSDTEISPESDTEPRLVGRESSERVDGVVIALWSIAAGMTVMLVVFLWHTSPRRRLRLARRRSTQLYDGEADLAAGAAGSDKDGDEVDDGAAAMQDAEAVAVAAAGADEDPELPPVWEDEAELAGEKADPADSGPANESPEAGKAGGESRSRFWMQLRRTLGLD